ncbi:MAG: hypothetical protein KGJ58_03735 [Patescibacteria group bacterium]|nr:hypothetical protein [Patescibacteria group bacterium]MDE1988619.1 hypothetical protein [Patescibacteria group bacterium]MDE2218534.1 hypothetical protein [Patescibacteria group bacterium]
MTKIENNKDMFIKLLSVSSSDEIAALIESDNFFKPENCEWKPYGGRDNNAGQVEGQMKSSSNALVEKLTNSIDALLMRRCYEVEGSAPDSKDPKLPKSLSEAIGKYFGGEDEINKKRSEWAKRHLVVLAEGDKKRPTLTVIDRGEGQSPDRIQNTIVHLSGSIKRNVDFVFGKYHQGGSAAIRFCGSKAKCYQLVLSRRAETIADKSKPNDYGWTLVRRNYKSRTAFYEYCADKDGNTFSFKFDKPLKIDGLDIEFTDGCLIRLYDYYLDNPSNITYGRNSLAFDIDQKLQKSPLPIYLQDMRGWRGDTKYTIAGLLRRIEDNKDIVADDITLPAGLGEVGVRNIRCIRLKHISDAKGVESYKLQREKIFYVENGLALGYENESFLRTDCQLPALAPYLLCYIDMSDIPVELANLFHAGREEFAHTDDYRTLKDRLKTFFENEIFEKWDKEYQEKSLASANENNKELDKLIEKAIVDDPELKELLGIGEEIKIPKGKEEDKEKYVGEEDPKKFEYVGEQPKEVDKSSYALVSFKTEAEDKLLTRKKNRYYIEWSRESKLFDVVLRGMNKGVISLRIDCKENAKIGDEDKITFSLLDSEKKKKFEQVVSFKAIETPPYAGSYFPTYFEPQKDVLKISPKTSKKSTFTTDVANDYFGRDADTGSIDFQERDDLRIKKYRLNDGILEITFYATTEKLGKVPDIKLAITDTANHRFDLVIPAEIVSPEESSKLNKPKRNPVYENDWPTYGWNENDIASVDSSRTQGLIVNLNIDSKPLKELKKMVGIDKVESAQNKYIADTYIYSLYLYFELKNDPDKDRILGSAMRAIGKALPGMVRKIV